MEQIRNDVKAHSSPFYLTLVSIIQSFALGFLLSTIGMELKASSSLFWPLTLQSLVAWLQVTAVFQAIVLTWAVNVSNAIVFRRVVGLTDSYIPFVFAVIQFFLVVFIAPPRIGPWFVAEGAFCAAAVWAFIDMYGKDMKETENKERFDTLNSYKIFNIPYQYFVPRYISLVGVVFLITGSWFIYSVPNVTISLMGVLGVNVLFLVFALLHRQSWQNLTAKA